MWSKSSLLLLLFCFLCTINISSGFPKSYRHPRQEKQQHRLPDHGLMDDSYGGLSGGQMVDGQQRDGKKEGYGNIDLDALGEDKKDGGFNLKEIVQKQLKDIFVQIKQHRGKEGYGSTESKKKQPSKYDLMDDSYGVPSNGQKIEDGQQRDDKKGYGNIDLDALSKDKKEGEFDLKEIFGKLFKDVWKQIKEHHNKKGYGSVESNRANGYQYNGGYGNGDKIPAENLVIMV